jgi:hypothetical protein
MLSPRLADSDSIARAQEDERRRVAQWQNDSFPQDPIMLFGIDLIIDTDKPPRRLFALPISPLPNLDTATEAVFFSVIEGDSLVELTFAGMPIIIRKLTFTSFASVENHVALTVYDEEQRAARASKILMGLPGIKK